MEEKTDRKQEFERRYFAFWKAPKRRYILSLFSSRCGFFPTVPWSEGACCLAAEALLRWFAAYGMTGHLQEAEGKYRKRQHVLVKVGSFYWDTKRIGKQAMFEQAALYLNDALEDVFEDYAFDEELCKRLFFQLVEELGEPPIELYQDLPAKQEKLFEETERNFPRDARKKM